MHTSLKTNSTSFCLSHICRNKDIYFKPEWVRDIVTLNKFYSIMSSVDASSFFSVAKFLLSAFYIGRNYYRILRMLDHLLHVFFMLLMMLNTVYF